MFDAPLRDLPIYRIEHLGLRLPHPLGDLLATAYDFESPPGKQRRHWIEIGAVGLAAEAGRLERNAAAPAKGVAHARHAPETSFAQFPHQLRQTLRGRAQMFVDGFPRVRGRAVHMLRPGAPHQLLVIAQTIEHDALQALFRRRLGSFLHLGPARIGVGRKPFGPLPWRKPPVDLL